MQKPVGVCRGKRLPCMDDGIDAIVLDRLDNHMHVVRHDAPGENAVASGIEVQDGIFNQLRDSWLIEPACSQAPLKVGAGRRKTVGQPERHESHRLG